MGGVQSQGCPRYSLFLGRREGWRGRGRRGGGEETSDSSDEFCLVELEFFGGVEAAGVSEGGGEVVGGFGEVRGEREGGDGDDGVFDCGWGEDSTVEVKKEGWGWGGGKGSPQLQEKMPLPPSPLNPPPSPPPPKAKERV